MLSYLKGQVGILMHAKDLGIIYDRKTLDIFLILLQFIFLRGKVDTLNRREKNC